MLFDARLVSAITCIFNCFDHLLVTPICLFQFVSANVIVLSDATMQRGSFEDTDTVTMSMTEKRDRVVTYNTAPRFFWLSFAHFPASFTTDES